MKFSNMKSTLAVLALLMISLALVACGSSPVVEGIRSARIGANG